MKRFVLLFGLLCLGAPALRAQVVGIDDTFDTANPCGNGWECIGSVAWVPPDADPCPTDDPNFFNPWATFDPLAPCTQYEGEGYVLVTPAVGNAGGHMFRSESLLYDNFKLTAVVELRDGSIARPADGMTIVIIGTEDPPPQGALGGAMGATGMGNVPTMIFEFDNWSCNGGDNNDQNHVQFAWSATGFPAVDSIPISPPPYRGVFAKVDEANYPLNNRQPNPAPNNRFTFEVLVQAGVVACYLSNDDVGLPRTLMYNFPIPNFQPFTGFLGVTGSTGGAWQNQILHSIKIESLPAGFCLAPAGVVTRDIQSPRTVETDCGDFSAGDVIPIALSIDARDDSAFCDPPVGATIVENLPEGWTASGISDGGVFNDPANTVTWTVAGGGLEGKVLTYNVTAPETPDLVVNITGTIVETIVGSEPAGTQGESELFKNTPFDACGGIRCWNILGGLSQPYFDNPGVDNMRLDYLTDLEVTEFDFPFFPGSQVPIAFGGDGISTGAASTGLQSGLSSFNPDGVPEVFAWNDRDNIINLNDDIFRGDPNNVMAYAQAYVVNTTGSDMDVYIGATSDDSIQVLLNGEEIWINSIPRGFQDLCIGPQDVSPDGVNFTLPHTLVAGTNSLIVKVFEGGGGWGYGIRFQDETGTPITDGLEVTKIPPGACIVQPLTATRDITGTGTILIEFTDQPKWTAGDTYSVSLAMSDIRSASGSCGAPTSVVIKETVPAGWTPSAPSNGGVINGNEITWTLSGGAIQVGSLTYSVTAGPGSGTVNFRGSVDDAGALGKGAVGGDSTLYNPTITTPDGFITEWLLLTPYRQNNLPTANPPEDLMRLDYLTDGINIDEIGVAPEAGDTVNTDYGPTGAARSTGLEPTVAPINPGGIPTWLFWRDLDDTINYERVHQGNEDNVVSYGFVYVNVDSDIVTDIGLASDDAVVVLLDGQEIWLNSVARGSGNPGTIQDVISSATVPALNPLTAGQHRLLVKVFEGGGDHNFRLRFQDPLGNPITSGISTCTDPDPAACVSVTPQGGFRRGDSNASGGLNITDGVFVLNYLFLGGPEPPCQDAADSDDNGQLNITDGVRILNYLFLGGPAPPDPGPDTCGPDPTADDLPTCVYESC